ncbi:F1F0 ATP synthase assembly protein-like protein Atp11 [Saccharata proteae CBS 121410]|uniref:F1F0 ATP synthase assembly protein-like protein Atp11 n=1 Tax=Saccharata proteae CBS 121410 TaxID=1314787 RepID=A0A9P4HRR3_9PEZI|nr:F1F0 ATP synthase assembly protein-like protein Atp11 [Saccharata proteae CBS 121410]
MASIRSPAVRHLVSRPLTCLRSPQRRWAQVHDVRFLATHNTQDRVLAKYREKLDQKAKEKGLKDISELKEAYKDKIDDLRKKAAVPGATAPLDASSKQPGSPSPFAPPPPAPKPTSAAAAATPASESPPPPGIKTLSSFIDVPKTLDLPAKEIEVIWRLRHARDPQSLSGMLTSDVWRTISANARRHPQFVLPLPREEQGAEIHFLQWTFPSETTATVLFTHLAEYKLRNEFSSPHTTVTFHTDLAAPKGVVLAQGTVVENRGVSVDEGKWLLMCLQKFYGLQAEEEGGRRKGLLEMFSRGDGGFKVEELLEEAEKI